MDDENSRDEHPNDGNPSQFGNGNGGSESAGSLVLRPVFLGNLNNTYTSEDVIEVFERPITPPNTSFNSIPVERVDLKRGYCFVFLKDAVSQEAKQNAERFVSDINGMYVPT
jgi:RNA recognition motif-containing protein